MIGRFCVMALLVPITLRARHYPVGSLVMKWLRDPRWAYDDVTSSMTYRPKTREVSASEFDSYVRDGVVLVQKVLDSTEVRKIHDAGQRIAEKPALSCILGQLLSVGGTFWPYNATCQFTRLVDQGIHDVATNSPLAHVAHQLIGPVRLLRDTLMVTASRFKLNWHVDRPVFFDDHKAVIAWCPTTTVSSLMFLNGTHRIFDWARQEHFPRLYPAINAFGHNQTEYYAPMVEPGDCLFFDDAVVHTSNNGSRTALQLRFFHSTSKPTTSLGGTWSFHPLEFIRAISFDGRPKDPWWSLLYPSFHFGAQVSCDNATSSSKLTPATPFEWLQDILFLAPKLVAIKLELNKGPADLSWITTGLPP